MMPHPGEIALFIALVAAFVLSVYRWIPGAPAASGALPRRLAYITTLAVTVAFVCLTYAYVTSDFSIVNVASHSHSTKPLFYKISGVWGNHEGSLLLWVWLLALLGLWGGVYSEKQLSHSAPLYWMILGTMLWGFLVFTLFASNPFIRRFPAPEEGNGLNPILQDVALAIHPPMLYLGYVGFGVVFVMALALLLTRRFGSHEAVCLKRAVLLALGVLTWGIMLGSWWAYRELGWGGYWFWDPVENASLLPWLAGAALAHTLWTVERRNVLQGWALLLAFIACIMSLLGTFLVRSGVLTSVHAFASDPDRGIYLLVFLVAAALAGFGAYALRGHEVAREGTFAFVSKENALVWNNILLCVILSAVLVGTLYPLLMEVFALPSISVGEPYFRQTALPIGVLALLLAAIAPHVRWKADAWRRVFSRRGRYLLLFTAIVTYKIVAHAPHKTPLMALGTAAALLLMISAVMRLWRTSGGQLAALISLRALPQRGLDVAHLGFAVMALGASLHAGYLESRDAALGKGATTTVAGYAITYHSHETRKGPDYLSLTARFEIVPPHGPTRELKAEKRFHPIQQMSTTEAALLPVFPFGHLYLALGDVKENGSLSLRSYYNPWINLIWLGGLLMGLGAIMSALRNKTLPR